MLLGHDWHRLGHPEVSAAWAPLPLRHPEVSATAEHALINDHRLAWEKATPIDHARNTRQRLVKEALWIHSLEGKLMNRDHGIELNPLWLELIRSD